MTLRTKLLGFFALLAVLPLLAMGLLHHVQSMRTVERHIAAQVGLIAERTAAELSRWHELHLSELLLLAGNAETQRLFRSLALAAPATPATPAPAELAAAESFAASLWLQMSPYYHGAELRDRSGAPVIRLGDRAAADAAAGPAGVWSDEAPAIETPILDEVTGAALGTVVARPRRTEVLPPEALDVGFGTAGYTQVLDRPSGRVLHDSRGPSRPRGPAPGPAELGYDPSATVLASPAGALTFRHGDSTRVAAFVAVAGPPWTVVSVASLDEFAAPFERMRALNLGVALLVILAVAMASVLLVRRATRSLEELTAAAGQVARGDLGPALPPPGADEVGRLAAAFATMVDRIRAAMAELQASRQMAAVGEFAAELAHEIRNPLTSVKLNLQRIERAVGAAGGPAEAAAPVRIALREVARLERVVRGVLHLGRPRPLERGPVSLAAVARDAIEVARPEAEAAGVRIEARLDDGPDLVLADADQLRGAVLNLLLNGVEAMADGGGTLTVRTARDDADGGDAPGVVALTVRDTGPGIPPAARESLFRPFFTTKPDGTGLGLAVALRTVEEHGGRLELLDPEPGDAGGGGAPGAGAAFRLALPLLGSPTGARVAAGGSP